MFPIRIFKQKLIGICAQLQKMDKKIATQEDSDERGKTLVYLIAGYSKAGKDYFAMNLSEYTIYTKSGNPGDLNYLPLSCVAKFADRLIGVCDALFNSIEPHEKRKDQQPAGYEGTYRDYMKAIAIAVKSIDREIFAKALLYDIAHYHGSDVKVTDFRFPEEFEYLKSASECNNFEIITIRVHRTGITIPKNIASENSLDNFDFDFYVFPKNCDYQALQELKCINPHALGCKKVQNDI